MNRIRFGKTELMVSRIALGGIPIERISVNDAVRVVHGAFDLGINFIDTAHTYTDSEEKIGLAIKGMRRDSLILATKSPARDKKTFLEHLDLSLRRLGTDYIDVYQHHNISDMESYGKIMGEGGAYEGMMEAQRTGKVRYMGFSGHDLGVAIKIMRDGKFDAVQLGFNYIDNEPALEAVPLAKELDMGFLAMKPFGGGMLDDAKLTIMYLLQFENVVPDPGIEKLSEIEEIAGIIESGEKFSEDDAAAIEKIKTEFSGRWCHRCDYCQPCPQKVAISAILALEKSTKRLPYIRVLGHLEQKMKTALDCTQCRECVPRCPYNLDIPELVSEKLEIWNRYIAANS